MAITVVGNEWLRSGTGGGNLTVSKPAGTLAGDLIILSVDVEISQSSWSWPSGFTQLFGSNYASDQGGGLAWKIAGASEPASYTVNIGADGGGLSCTVFRGVDPDIPFDAWNTATGRSTAPTAPSITTSVANCLLLCVCIYNLNIGLTYPPGMQYVWDFGHPSDTTSQLGIVGEQAAAGATGTKVFGSTSTINWLAALIALRPKPDTVTISAPTTHDQDAAYLFGLSSLSGSGTAYQNAREATGSYSVSLRYGDDQFSPVSVGQDLFSIQRYCNQAFFAFDVPVLAEGLSLAGATLVIPGLSTPETGDGDQSLTDFTIEARRYSGSPPITAAAFRPGSTLGTYDLLGTFDTAGWASTDDNAFTPEAGFAALLEGLQGQRLWLFVSSNRQRLGIEPTTQEVIYFQGGPYWTEQPRLRLTVEGAGAGPQGLTASPFTDADAFGTPAIQPGAVGLAATGFADADSFGAATVTPSTTLAASPFTDADDFDAPALSVGPASLTAAGFADGETFGTATVQPGPVALAATGFADPDAFGAATVSQGAVVLAATGFADADTFGTATLAATVGLTAAGFTDADGFGAPTVQPGPVTLAAAGIDDPDAFGSPAVARAAMLTASPVEDADGFGAATLAVGPVGLAAAGFDDADQFGAPVVSQGEVALAATPIDEPDVFGAHTVAAGPVALAASPVTDTDAFGAPVVSQGAVVLAASPVTDADGFGAPAVTAGPVTLAATGFTDADAFGAHVASQGEVLLAALPFDDADAFGSATVEPGAVALAAAPIEDADAFGAPAITAGTRLAASGFDDTDAFGQPAISTGAASLAASPVTDADAFGAAVVRPGPVALIAAAIENAPDFGGPRVGFALAAAGLIDPDDFGVASLAVGPVALLAAGIDDADAFGTHVLSGGQVVVRVARLTGTLRRTASLAGTARERPGLTGTAVRNASLNGRV